MTKTEILNYVMETPYNTNKQILSLMLDKFEESISGGNITSLINKTITSIDNDSTIVSASIFENCETLRMASFEEVIEIKSYAFNGCTNLENINFPNVIKIGSYAFSETGISNLYLPKVESLDIYSFYKCENLKEVNLPKLKEIGSSTFAYCPLESITLANSQVCLLSDIGAFANTPIQTGEGYIYVPSSLVETYKNSTNWIAFANKIKAIEESE